MRVMQSRFNTSVRHRVRSFGFAISVLIAVASFVFSGNVSAEPMDQEPGCEPRIVHNYEAPIHELPKVHRLPRSGRLPFAPSRSRFERITQPIIAHDGAFGFEFAPERGHFHLNWRIISRVARVDRSGKPVRVIKSRVQDISSVRNLGRVGVWLNGLHALGLYRATLVFRSMSNGRIGRILGRYSEYARVVKPIADVRLNVKPEQVSSGGVVKFRLENFGTLAASTGREFRVERFDGAGWVMDPASPSGPWFEDQISLPAGAAGMCDEFEVQPSMPVGLYRISKEVNVGSVLSNISGTFSLE